MRIYLDVCCLNRPFDDNAQDRIRLESEAVLAILRRYQGRSRSLLGSEVIDFEISQIPDDERRQKVMLLSAVLRPCIIVDVNAEKRAIELEKLGFRPIDALHIACAEKGKADVLLTTDDDLLRRALQYKEGLKVRVENPVKWLMEEIER
jgi:predicted nucleic acid-binding protein